MRSFASVLGRLVGDVLQLTGFLSYCGPFNQSFRDMLMKEIWEAELRSHKIPFTENLNLISALVDPPTVRKTQTNFNLSSLLAAQNVIYVLTHIHTPLSKDK